MDAYIKRIPINVCFYSPSVKLKDQSRLKHHMDSFNIYLLRNLYRDIEKLGDRLAEIEPHIDWTAFTPILEDLYANDGPQGGRPNTDHVLMVKILFLQA